MALVAASTPEMAQLAQKVVALVQDRPQSGGGTDPGRGPAEPFAGCCSQKDVGRVFKRTAFHSGWMAIVYIFTEDMS